MAMVKLAPGITEVNGKQGGNIWRYDQCGQHIQATPRQVSNEPSAAQKIRRKAFKKIINYIRLHATQDFVFAWQNYANQHPKRNKKGQMVHLTWYAMFVSYNINRVIAGEPIVPMPPAS